MIFYIKTVNNISWALLISIFIVGCNKKPCDDILCLNNGECVDGTCICPDGFSGDRCEIILSTFGCANTDAQITSGVAGTLVEPNVTLTEGALVSVSPANFSSINGNYNLTITAPEGYNNAGANIVCTVSAVAIPCETNNCESLNGVNSFVSSWNNAYWQIGNGYFGNGFAIQQGNYGGFIEFTNSNPNTTKISFWTKTTDNQNRVPDVTLNNVLYNTFMINGSAYGNNWMQLETESFPAGYYNVKINFPDVSHTSYIYIDEIEFWCF